MILVGYERDYTYRLYDKYNNRIVISKDVLFDETKSINFAQESNSEVTILDDVIVQLESDDINEHVQQEETCGVDDVTSTDDTQQDDNVEIDNTIVDDANVNNDHDTSNTSDVFEEAPQTPIRSTSLRPRENIRKPDRLNYCAEALYCFNEEPLCYKEAVSHVDSDKWKKAMDNEIQSLKNNYTWILCQLPNGRKPINCKWVYKVKRTSDGNIQKYKARLVACGYSQKFGIDYKETFSPVARLESIRIILSIAASENMEISHFDVQTAFLHGVLEECIYMQQPEGYSTNKNNEVCKLQRSLYGLKQASRVWNRCFVDFVLENKLVQLQTDSCVFIKKEDNKVCLIMALYVDDGILCTTDKKTMVEMLNKLKSRFLITIMDAECILGIKIERDRVNRTITLSQSYYISRIIDRFGLTNAKDASTPVGYNQVLCKNGATDGKMHATVNVPYREAIGSIMYLMLGTRPDIAYGVTLLSRFCEDPKLVHWEAVKRLIRYLTG